MSQPMISQTKLMVNYIPEQLSLEGMQALFSSAGRIHSCRLVGDRGYGFVEYSGPEEAERARATFDGLNLHGKALRVAFAHVKPDQIQNGTSGCNLYVSGLPPDTCLETVNALFRPFGNITSSRAAHGVAFVRFETRRQAEDAIAGLNGVPMTPGSQPLTVKFALRTPVQGKGSQRFNPMAMVHPMPLLAMPAAGEPPRTTVYVYNIGDDTDELALWQLFGPYGAIDSIKVIKDAETKKNRGFAFVNMRDHEEAARAIRALDGYALNGQVLSVSFKTHKKK